MTPLSYSTQAFAKRDRNKHRAQVVAERLVRQFPIEVSQPQPGSTRPSPRCSQAASGRAAAQTVAAHRRSRQPCRPPRSRADPGATVVWAGPVWYLDLGNRAASGQLYLGNALDADQLRGAFDEETHTFTHYSCRRSRPRSCSTRQHFHCQLPMRIAPRHRSRVTRSRSSIERSRRLAWQSSRGCVSAD